MDFLSPLTQQSHDFGINVFDAGIGNQKVVTKSYISAFVGVSRSRLLEARFQVGRQHVCKPSCDLMIFDGWLEHVHRVGTET